MYGSFLWRECDFMLAIELWTQVNKRVLKNNETK